MPKLQALVTCLLVLFVTTNATNWQTRVYTSDLVGASTNAYVYIAVYGSLGWTDPLALDESNYDDNEQGQMDIHTFNTTDVGRPLKVLVWHAGGHSHNAWHLNKIELKNMANGETYTFNAHRWISPDKYNGQVTIELELDVWQIVDELRSRIQSLEEMTDSAAIGKRKTH